ncbi:hypothetical protein EFT87_01735 [Schleiferilactobacillus harbinensis]|uniref:hypothetical protein n=1 Tax=Schleiferilactobacillus harbinensis TaxID=304207 RepID=UPI0021A739C4|nr:hypothetical protein [Schleiferilactobacillus harbinensis]MCT2907386.1 hypothetical protein [Schleiferilactobacillus harbinensis]
MDTALNLLIFVALVAIPVCFIGFVLAILRKKPYIKWQKRTRYSLIAFLVFVATELIVSLPVLNTFMYGIRIVGIVLFVEGLMDLIVSIVTNKPKLKWVLILCSSIALMMIASAGINAMDNASHKSQDAASSKTDDTDADDDDDTDTNDDDDGTAAGSTSSEDSSADSSSVAASSKAAASKSEQASSKAASKSMALGSFKKSLQARVQNDSVHLSSYQLNGGNEVTYTATAETAAFDRATLQAYADHLFDNTQQLAAMCDISTPVFIVLQAPNGNFLARTKLDGTAKVYPQN